MATLFLYGVAYVGTFGRKQFPNPKDKLDLVSIKITDSTKSNFLHLG